MRWVRLAARALENLAGAHQLLQAGHFNAAASRLYWSAFLGCAHALAVNHECGPEDCTRGEDGWNQTMISSNLRRVIPGRGEQESDLRARYRLLKSAREKADYSAEGITEPEVHQAATSARDLHAYLGLAS